MQEFASVSAPSIDPAALATKLTEKSSEGWTVVSIVAAGGDITAFLSREGSAAAAVAETVAAAEPVAVVTPVVEAVAPAAAEPAGWGTAPAAAEPAPAYQPTPAQTYQPTPAQTYQPAPAAQPVVQQAATPAVPSGWYADPAGRFELRYWDGGAWTEHVSRGGQQYTDPPVA